MGAENYIIDQIRYGYTMEVTNRFSGLDLINRVPEELWAEGHNILQETDQNHPKEKEMQQGNMVVCRGIPNS